MNTIKLSVFATIITITPLLASAVEESPSAEVITEAVASNELENVDSATQSVDASAIIREEGTDEIDLEEDDSALAAKKPQIKGDLTSGTSALVDIDCDEATLADILRQFRKTTGANIISDDSTNLQRRVSVSLRKVPWLQGLTAILNSRGFRLDERENIFRVAEDLQAVPLSTRTFQLNHASAKELAALFNASYALKDGNGKVLRQIATSFEGANVVVVTASEKVISDCEAIIRSVDRPLAQAYIEARFVELDAGAGKQLGIKWNSLKNGWTVNAGPFSGGGTVSTAKRSSIAGETTLSQLSQKPYGDDVGYPDLGYKNAWGLAGELSAAEFSLTMQAIESMDNASTFSNPKIIVQNEHKASVDMTTKFPNVRVTASRTTQSGSTSMDISAAIEQIPGESKLMFAKEAFYAWGITLDVTPRVSPDGLITVDIVPTISQLDETVGDGSGFYSVETSSGDNATPYSRYPILAVKRIESQFTMKDGATAVIGGLTKTIDSVQETGIPLLRSIPWAGPRFFSWKSHVKMQKEIIIFVTVGIANPESLPKDIGLPKNAVIGREFVEGRRLEPGDAGLESTLRIKDVNFEDDAASTKPGTISIRPAKD